MSSIWNGLSWIWPPNSQTGFPVCVNTISYLIFGYGCSQATWPSLIHDPFGFWSRVWGDVWECLIPPPLGQVGKVLSPNFLKLICDVIGQCRSMHAITWHSSVNKCWEGIEVESGICNSCFWILQGGRCTPASNLCDLPFSRSISCRSAIYIEEVMATSILDEVAGMVYKLSWTLLLWW